MEICVLAAEISIPSSGFNSNVKYIYLHENDLKSLIPSDGIPTHWVRLYFGGDFIFTAKVVKEAQPGHVYLNEAQRLLCRFVPRQRVNIQVYDSKSESGNLPLSIVSGEVWLKSIPSSLNKSEIHVDGAELARIVKNQCFDHMISVDEKWIVTYQDHQLVYRVTEVQIEEDDSIVVAGANLFSSSLPPVIVDRPEGDELLQRRRPNLVNVYSSDDELFIVKKRHLKPCIALTRYVRGVSEDELDCDDDIHLNIPCLVLDRVLLFLDLVATGTEDCFKYDLEMTPDLLKAAEELKCSRLKEICQRFLGKFESRVRSRRWQEILESINQGKAWIVISGMVFDVTEWLPEHPGGDEIILGQALGVDATFWFEMFHATRESFTYLKDFFIGEIIEEDLCLIPSSPGSGKVSEDFLEQLDSHTAWRFPRQDSFLRHTYFPESLMQKELAPMRHQSHFQDEQLSLERFSPLITELRLRTSLD